MRRVLKWPIEVEDVFALRLPIDSEVIHVDLQDGEPFMWTLGPASSDTEERIFFICGTGSPVQDDWTHLASFQQPLFVWHLFEQERSA